MAAGQATSLGMQKLGKTSDMWIEEFYAWIKATGFLKK